MSDLISRSQLLKEIEKYKFGAISNDAEREYIKKTILDFIVCQPTTYDIDKVIEELKNHKDTTDLTTVDEEMVIGFTVYQGAFNDGIEQAIEIVKQGCVSDDVCEWKLKDACYTSSIKHYDALPTSIVKTFTSCPYCGKKIKVVE